MWLPSRLIQDADKSQAWKIQALLVAALSRELGASSGTGRQQFPKEERELNLKKKKHWKCSITVLGLLLGAVACTHAGEVNCSLTSFCYMENSNYTEPAKGRGTNGCSGLRCFAGQFVKCCCHPSSGVTELPGHRVAADCELFLPFFFFQNKEFFQNEDHWLGNRKLKCRLLLTDPVMLCLPDLSSCQLVLRFQIYCPALTGTATLLLATLGGEVRSFSSSLCEFFPWHVSQFFHSWRFPFGLWQKEGSGR